MTSSVLVAPTARRAASYVRMSTERQQYSAEIQTAAIEDFAAKHGISIVRSYSDKGKSGLTITGREGLQALIFDVQNRQATFDLLLVYDVSRWGRFQDADEAAYYEFLCTKAGIKVVYCAEQFSNDGSATATIIKSIKRVMAAEFSRELSKKTFHGQCQLVEKGCRVGSAPGYGLRRLMVDETGIAKLVLRRGEQKSLQTDRVVLIPGPDEEVAVVARIYWLFLDAEMTIQGITDLLNQEGVVTDLGRRWTRDVVTQVLTNEKYLGNNVFNRTSKKLKGPTVRNPEHMWVRANGAFPPLIDVESFERVRARLKCTAPRYSSERLITELAALAAQGKTVCERVINQQPSMATAETYRARFGSLQRAYELAGIRTSLTDDQMLQDLVKLQARVGPLTERVMIREKGSSCPKAYRRRFGSLKVAFRKAGFASPTRSNETMLNDLIRLHSSVGRLTELGLTKHKSVACAATYRLRFGGLAKAYELAGLAPPRPI